LTEQTYLNRIHRQFGADSGNRKLFSRISSASSEQRKQILRDAAELIKRRGLAYGLLALYRQQVNCGFVLDDPLSPRGKKIKRFRDKRTGVEFQVMWDSGRALRKNHKLLIERGIIAGDVDKSRMINIQKDGRPCYLCRQNIALQNPAEIIQPMRLAGEDYFAGANFAYIENNHFTIISARHRRQRYEKHILASLIDFVLKTDGFFRVIFNGLAGATILWHEHLQATTEPFPVESIRIRDKDIVVQKTGFRVSRPFYYLPLWVVEGNNSNAIIEATDHIIVRWQKLNPEKHTENVITAKSGKLFRIFIFLRDTRRQAGKGKFGGMASFECGGSIVLSYKPKPGQKGKLDEQRTFNHADIDTVRRLLAEIKPVADDNGKRTAYSWKSDMQPGRGSAWEIPITRTIKHETKIPN
jgi:hypothetical protein